MKNTDKKTIKIPVRHRSSSFAPPLDYRIVSDTEIEFTPAKAFEFLEMKSFQGERPAREGHVQFMYDEFCAGRFMWEHVIIAACRLNGVLYRINGQHTCWMRVNIPKDKEPVDAKVRFITYEVDTEDQLRALYSTFDRNAPRTPSHVGKVLLINSNAGRDIPVSYLNHLVAGFRVYFSEDTGHMGRVMTIDDLVAMIEANFSEQFNIVGRFYQLHVEEAAFIKRASVVGAMFATFEKNVQASTDFWTAVATGINLGSKTDARYQLRKFLQTYSQSLTGNKVVSKEQMFCTCILAWNRWMNNEEVVSLRIMDERQKVRAVKRTAA